MFSDMEITYKASLLKKKIHSADDVMPPEEVREIFDKALRTLKVRMHDLLLVKAYSAIAEEYTTSAEVSGRKSEQSSHDEEY